MENVPEGGVLMVSNHSGGLIAMDVPIIAVAFAEEFGNDRPLYVLAHDLLFMGSAHDPMMQGRLPARHPRERGSRLRSGGVTIVFPGGDYDVFRPSSERNKIDFDGRTGYVRTALEAGVPIVPIVSIGGQEDQIHLSRGELLAKLLSLEKRLRTKYLPVTFGFPFGLTLAFPRNLPLPTKIDTRVLDADRHHRGVRARPRHRRGGPRDPRADAGHPGRARPPATVPGDRMSTLAAAARLGCGGWLTHRSACWSAAG